MYRDPFDDIPVFMNPTTNSEAFILPSTAKVMQTYAVTYMATAI